MQTCWETSEDTDLQNLYIVRSERKYNLERCGIHPVLLSTEQVNGFSPWNK